MALRIEDVLTLLNETEQKFQETRRLVDALQVQAQASAHSLQQHTVDFQEIFALFRETDRKFQETDRKFQETDRKFQETDRKFQETDRQIKILSQSIGRVHNRLGEFVEEMVKPAVLRLFQARGIAVHEVMRNVTGERDGLAAEIDLLAVDTTEAVAVEVKSQLTREYVKEHLQRLERFKRIFIRYADVRLYGAVAGMVVLPDAAQYAEAQGLFVLQPSGEHIQVSNAASFQPKSW